MRRKSESRPSTRLATVGLAALSIVLCAGCIPGFVVPECMDVDAQVCSAVWAVAKPELRLDEPVVRARVEPATEAAGFCDSEPCPEEMWVVSVVTETLDQVFRVERLRGELRVRDGDIRERADTELQEGGP